jgi:predicted nucleic acid-binding protein
MGPLIDEVVVVETSVWVDYFRNAPTPHCNWLDDAMGRRPLGITDLSLCEVLQGIPREREFQRVKDYLSRFNLHRCVGGDMAVATARHYRTLRAAGITIRKTIDSLIATYCIERGYWLLHNDRDFDPFEAHLGLKVVHPAPIQ